MKNRLQLHRLGQWNIIPDEMKNRFFSVILVCTFFACGAFAQELAVKVSIITHEDGSRTVTKTEPEQHTSEQTTFSIDNKQLGRILFLLNENDQAVSGTVFDAKNKPTRKMVYQYDTMNRISEEQNYSPKDQFLGKFVYEYDLNGKLSKIRSFDADGKEIVSPGRKVGK